MRRRDLAGFCAIAATLTALLAYRAVYVEPREWGAICASAPAPLACAPRAGLLWMQYEGLWGGVALALGLWAFLGGPFAAAVSAIAFGIAGVVNYNATFGMLGAALGAWAWLSRKDEVVV